MHNVQVIRTNMGRYTAVCSCGWISKKLNKKRAREEALKHEGKIAKWEK